MDTQLPNSDVETSSQDLIDAGSNGLDNSRPTFEYLNNASTAPPSGAILNDPEPAASSPKPVAAAPAQAQDGSGVEPMKPAEKARLRREATQGAKGGMSAERLTKWLVDRGMSQAEAKQMATSCVRTAASHKQAVVAQRRQDMGLAWAEIIGGIVLLIAGLAAGWFVGLFLVPIFDGFRRLAN